ncbi:hypothetical protein K505DRAFT_356789 [Melanomma pulvis-pyrius CBS 109.77]|uniref:RNase III domain-containing protein n=1 Tax=Melanomma pulvis-pyrius CBS 109.77 TaxID=1314802 RepID=A0A6A6XUF9_9PLEO|nr:hypothetical protein K505DRAFT_356789 [Melanomma pulvis-pyrius CBS 109.77]
MSLDYVQQRINYKFVHLQFLSSALQSAEKDNVKGYHCDGNRGLSNMGVCAMEMVATRNTILIRNGTKRDVDTIEHWSRSKRGRAKACMCLGLDRYVVQSVRQHHVQPSPAVLAYTLSAIIGAVWFDLERYKSGLDMMKQITEILARIDMLVADESPEESPMAIERSISVRDITETPESITKDDQNFTTWNQHTNGLEVLLLQGPFKDQSEALEYRDYATSSFDTGGIYQSDDPDPSYQFHGTVHDLALDAADAQMGSMQMMDTTRFDPAAIEFIHDNNPTLGLEETIQIHDTCQGHPTSSHIVASSHQVSSDTTKISETAVVLSRRGKSQEHGRTLHNISLHERLVREELAKLQSPPTQLRLELANLLDHDEIDRLSAHTYQRSQLRLLYFEIGSCQSLRGFKKALHLARGSPSYIYHRSRHALSCAERFREICRLDDTECLCVLLRRFHIVKLFEEELEVLYPRHGMIVETPSSFGERQTAEMGNPSVRRKAALTNAVLHKIKPELQEGTLEHRRCRAQVKQMRRLADMLGTLTSTYGFGILALLPCRPAYPELSPLETILSTITDENFRLFLDILYASQGRFLQELSKAVEPALIALMDGELVFCNPFPIEDMAPEVLDEQPKGSTAIIRQLSEPTSSYRQ